MTDPTFVPGKQLGRRPAHADKPALLLGDFLTGAVPEHPASVDHLDPVHDFGLYGNDQHGDCGPTSVANSRILTTHFLADAEQVPTLDDVYDLYRRSGNPNFPTDDQGVVMQDMLAEVVRDGIGGVKALGFAKVDVGNLDELDAAVAIFGFLLYGVTLEVAQQHQATQWDYVRSGEWGGHAVLGGAYGTPGRGVITWGDRVEMTNAFIAHQLDEAWVVIWPEHLNNRAFLDGVDLPKFAAAYKAITGRAFPVPVPVTPPPANTDGALVTALRRFLSSRLCPAYLRTAAQAWLAGKA